jgi:hypothetical protein
MSKAFVDTTILTNALLKPSSNQSSKDLLNKYSETQLPVYTIKEFKAGPLGNFAWFHNKLELLGSFRKAMGVLQGVSMSPSRYRVSTALEAIMEATYATGKTTAGELVGKYGALAEDEAMITDRYRLAIKDLVYKAWKKRRKMTTKVVQELSCYEELELKDNRGLIELKPTKCKVVSECCLADALRSNPGKLRKLCTAIQGQPRNREREKRYQILTDLLRKPKMLIDEKMCRYLGDAIIVYFAPDDATILTTNLKDHESLAAVLGKSVESPAQTT